MRNSLKDVVLYNEVYGELSRQQVAINNKDDAVFIAERLLAPYMGPHDKIISWECGIGTNFNIITQTAKETFYSLDAVVIRNFH